MYILGVVYGKVFISSESFVQLSQWTETCSTRDSNPSMYVLLVPVFLFVNGLFVGCMTLFCVYIGCSLRESFHIE